MNVPLTAGAAGVDCVKTVQKGKRRTQRKRDAEGSVADLTHGPKVAKQCSSFSFGHRKNTYTQLHK